MGLLKQIYRYTHSRAYRHNENLWPEVKIQRKKTGEIYSVSYKKENIKLKNINEIKKTASNCLIVASGPSMNTTIINRNNYDVVFAVNGSYIINNRMRFTHYLVVDQDFVLKRFDIISMALENENLIFLTTAMCLWRIKKIARIEIKCHLIIVEDICEKVYYAKTEVSKINNAALIKHEKKPEIAFSTDIREGIVDCGTVVYWAMQIAYFMEAKKITFSGLDMRGFNKPRFYETEKNTQPSKLQSNFESRILPAFYLASKVMRDKKITTLNLSIGSAIPNEIINKNNEGNHV